ncbi:hypothetical protein ACFYWS_22195 [Streptomyces sp. NPDC002795]|uniref:hypothetical protein n=1 Tax=Streptomyces sp. NPDC002795 TaxID=3364665 RepID=UPI0036C6B63C
MIAETVCSAVAVAGLGIAGVLAFRKRFLKAARTAAYALVPLGLVMTGAVEWIVDTAFSPTAWAGFGVLGVAWLMFMGTRAVERRRSGGTGKKREAVAPAASAPSLGESRPVTPAVQPKQSKQAKAEPAEDFSDIEAILKKHGI